MPGVVVCVIVVLVLGAAGPCSVGSTIVSFVMSSRAMVVARWWWFVIVISIMVIVVIVVVIAMMWFWFGFRLSFVVVVLLQTCIIWFGLRAGYAETRWHVQVFLDGNILASVRRMVLTLSKPVVEVVHVVFVAAFPIFVVPFLPDNSVVLDIELYRNTVRGDGVTCHNTAVSCLCKEDSVFEHCLF